jgi:hypothetical protein
MNERTRRGNTHMAKRLRLEIPNIPYGYADAISDEEWKYIRSNFPADYKYAQKLIKEHEEEQAAEEGGGDKADEKPVEAAKPAAEPKSAPKSAGKEG